jgi:hypothetical protein
MVLDDRVDLGHVQLRSGPLTRGMFALTSTTSRFAARATVVE